MQDAFTGDWTWDRAAHGSAVLRKSLRELNRHFLDLVAVQTDQWSGSRRVGLPDEVSGRVAPLTAAQKTAMADCPYALFDLRFHDAEHWQQLLRHAGPWRVTEAWPADPDLCGFTQMALFFAWHVASAGSLSAQLLLGMNELTAAAFRSTTVDCLPALVASEAAHLTARWNHRHIYWNSLIGAATRPDAAALRRVHLYGLQLAAAVRLH